MAWRRLTTSKSVQPDDDVYTGYNDYIPALETADIREQGLAALSRSTSSPEGTYDSSPEKRDAPRPLKCSTLGIPSRDTTSASGRHYYEGAVTPCRPSTPLGRPISSMVGTPRALKTITAARYFNDRRGIATPNCRWTWDTPPAVMVKVTTVDEQMRSLQLQLSEHLLGCRQAESPQHALELAKEAQEKERQLSRLYDSHFQDRFHYNTGLTFAVVINLAGQYEANRMYKEALSTYRIVERSTTLHDVYRVKINMANMYVKLCQYPLAIKTYRKALDQVPRELSSMRIKILRNMGVIFFKTNQLKEAIVSFTTIMEEQPGFVEGMNLMVCLYALGSKTDMKTCFEMLLDVPLESDNGQRNPQWEDNNNLEARLLNDEIKNSSLHRLLQKRKHEAERIILMSARLVAVSIGESVFDGFEWCIEAMKGSQFSHLVGEIQIAKGAHLLNEGGVEAAIGVYEDLLAERGVVRSAAATNLVFIHLTRGAVEVAEKLGEDACNEDAYSSPAMVNAACCELARGNHSSAKERLAAAVDNDALCFEALYDLGLVNKRMGLHEEATSCFLKLRTVFPEDRLVLYHLASLAELAGDLNTAIDRYQQLLCSEPKNALTAKKLGELHDRIGESVEAHHFYLDSYRSFPSQVDVLSWLGNYSLKLRCPEDAVKYFNLAIQCEPHDIKWRLMVASCYRRCGNLTKATEYYEEIHELFPENTESLKYLVKHHLPVDKEKAKKYATMLKKLKSKQIHRPNSYVSPSSSTSSRIADNCYIQCGCNSTTVSTNKNELTNYHQPSFPEHTDTICMLESHQDNSNQYRHELLPTCLYDNENVMNNSRDGLDARCTSYASHCPDTVRSLEQSCQSLVDKSMDRGSILPGKLDVYTLFRSAQTVASDPVGPARGRGDISNGCQEPRVVFTSAGGEAYAPVLMRIGDSTDQARGECCSTCTSTPATPGLSRPALHEACNLGLKLFPENELDTDLLPD